MSGHEQCENCGAVLLPEDTFCGECGAPRPDAKSPAPTEAEPPALSPETTPAEAQEAVTPATTRPAPSTQRGWRAAFISLMVVGLLVCILGILAFVLFGTTEAEGWTAEENWLLSTICCLLPIAGSSLVLLLAGAAIWFARLRKS